MMLVVGGAHSGKRTFVREKLGFAADDFVDAAQLAEGGVPAAFAGRVAYRAEELVRALDADRALERADRLRRRDSALWSARGSSPCVRKTPNGASARGAWDARLLRAPTSSCA